MKFENYEGNFREIEEFPGYWVSDIGTVYSERSKKLLSPVKHHNGHLVVCLRKEKRQTQKLIHRLVFEAFFEQPEVEDYVIHHLDHNKTNNCITNLCVMTREDHSRLHGNEQPGKPRICIKCLETGDTYESFSAASKALGLNAGNITSYFKGKCNSVKGYHFEKVGEEDEI